MGRDRNDARAETVFALKPVYDKIGVAYIDARAKIINVGKQTVTLENANGTASDVHYDYLVNATGPYLNFEGTPGLGPATGNTMSVCTVEHAVQTRERYLEIVRAARGGKRQRIAMGVGHPAAPCEGAGFKYLMNVHADLKRRGVRDLELYSATVKSTLTHRVGSYSVAPPRSCKRRWLR